jgi:nucleoside-diphosphate-sugar epimerase
MTTEKCDSRKRILVTGGTGKVGSRLIPRLVQWGYLVNALVRSTESAVFIKSNGAKLIIGDLLDTESLKAAIKNIDVVIHLATFYKDATEDQSRMANIDATEILAKTAIENGVKNFIFTSSNRVYGSNRGKLVSEIDDIQPAGNRFAIAKAEVENLLLKVFENSTTTLCILRLSLAYGDSDTHLKETIQSLNGWSPAQRMQMVHHADIAQAVKLSIAQNANGIFNVTDDAPLSISELRFLHQVADTPYNPIDDPWEMIVSNRKIREQLGFRPYYPTFYSAHDAGTL